MGHFSGGTKNSIKERMLASSSEVNLKFSVQFGCLDMGDRRELWRQLRSVSAKVNKLWHEQIYANVTQYLFILINIRWTVV